jgi:hypothetical protein
MSVVGTFVRSLKQEVIARPNYINPHWMTMTFCVDYCKGMSKVLVTRSGSVRSPKRVGSTYQTARSHVPYDSNLYTQLRER